MHRIGLYYKFLRNKSHDTGRFFHQLRDSFTGILVSRTQFFLRIILRDVFQTKNPDREILPTEFFPVRYLLVENVLYLSRAQRIYLIAFVQSQHVPFFNHLAIEQPESLRKQEKHNQQDCNTCYETATSQNSFYYFLKNLLHTYWFSDAKKATPY